MVGICCSVSKCADRHAPHCKERYFFRSEERGIQRTWVAQLLAHSIPPSQRCSIPSFLCHSISVLPLLFVCHLTVLDRSVVVCSAPQLFRTGTTSCRFVLDIYHTYYFMIHITHRSWSLHVTKSSNIELVNRSENSLENRCIARAIQLEQK